MEVRVLGPLEVVAGDGVGIRVGGPKERAVLAVLALHVDQVVSWDRLIDALWGDDPPRTATRTLQSYLSVLRRALDDTEVRLESAAGGAVLRLGAGALDLARAEGLVSRGRQEAERGDHTAAAATFAEALTLWRGRPLEDFSDQLWAVVERNRLEELRQTVLEARIDADLARGRHAEVIGELEVICATHPLRERAWAQRMTALYRAGRQAEALRVYQQLRTVLGEELGIEPSPPLARLEQAILVHDPSLELSPPPEDVAPPSAAPAPLVAADFSEAVRPAPIVDSLSDDFGPVAAGAIVTLLFTDIVGSTELLQRLGDEGYDQVRRAHFRMVRDVVAERGGTTVKNLGDGFMAVFPSAVDAVGCAVGIQLAVARHNRRSGDGRFEVRVGLNAGEPLRDEDDYFGASVVIAKRLCDAAPAGSVVASRLVAELVGTRGDYSFGEPTTVALKGISEPVAACTVEWSEEPARPLPPALAALQEASFVGRAVELSDLEAAWREAEGGRRQVVLVAGEPGIGKTTLAVQTARAAWEGGAIVLFGHCDEASMVPFQPFVEALGQYVEGTAPAELRNELGSQAVDLALLVPGLGHRLPEVADVRGTGAETERYRIFEAVVALLRAVGTHTPVVMVLDDLHWADRPTLQLLHHLIRSSADVPMLIIGTYRDTDLVRTHPMAEVLVDLRRAELVRRLPLRGLALDDVLGMVAPGTAVDDDDRALAEALWTQTEGNPLFLREILRHLAETDAITRDDEGRWRARRRLAQLGIPEGVKEVIGRRVTRLSGNANAVLSVASVTGREFAVEVVDRLSELPLDTILDALEEAVAAGVITELGHQPGTFGFTHALVRQALYEELSLTRRVLWHRRVGEALEGLHEGRIEPHLAELAYHFAQAAASGAGDKAIEYCRRAGDADMAHVAYEEAARHFATALEIAADTGEPSSVRAPLLLRLGDAQWRAGDPQTRSTFMAVAALARQEDDPETLARAALGYAGAGIRFIWVEAAVFNQEAVNLLEEALERLDPTDSVLRALLLSTLARELYWMPGTRGRREALGDEAVGMARRLGDPATLAHVLANRCLTMQGLDTAPVRADDAAEVLAIGEELGDTFLVAVGKGHLAIASLERGDVVAAVGLLDELSPLVDELREPAIRDLERYGRATILDGAGDFQAAECIRTQAFQGGQEIGDRNVVALYLLGEAVSLRRQGRTPELIGPGRAALELYPLAAALVHALLACAHAEADDVSAARQHIDAVDLGDPELPCGDILWLTTAAFLVDAVVRLDDRARVQPLYELLLPYEGFFATVAHFALLGSVGLWLGKLASLSGQHDLAVAHLERALDAHEKSGLTVLVVEAQVDLAAALRARGAPSDRDAAHELARAALASASELGLTGLAERARALEEGTPPRPVPDESDDGPTRRDRSRSRLTHGARKVVGRLSRDHTDAELIRRFGAPTAQRALFGAMAKSFQPSAACGFQGRIQFELVIPTPDPDPLPPDYWTIEVRGRRATSRRQRVDLPDVKVATDLPTLVRVLAGAVHPMRAVIDGCVRVEGDILAAARLVDMFGGLVDEEDIA